MKKKIIAGASAITLAGVIVAASVMTGFIGKDDAPTAAQVRVTALQKGNIAVSTSANGMVYSTSVTQVSSNLDYSVKNVYISVGDRVKEGDVLAEVDTSELQSNIEQKKASLSSSQASAQLSLAEAQNNLAIYQRNLEEGYDSNLINAESAIVSAEKSVADAEKSVADAEVSVSTAELDLSTATTELRTARSNYRDAYDGDGDYTDGVTDSQLTALRNTVSARENSVEKSQYSLENAKRNLESAKRNLENAEQNLDKAHINYEAAKLNSADSITSYQNKVKSAQLSNNFSEQQLSLEKLEGDLEKAVLTSPVTGTVTSVEAVVGGSSKNLLFIIQDTDHLKIVTNVQEYDIGTVAIGNKVIITTEATGDLEFEGTLTQIAPTSTLTTKGDAASSTTAEYEAEVTVSSSAPKGLLVGMNALLSIVTEEKKDVYHVPSEAVASVDGQSVIYTIKKQDDDTTIAEAVNVTTGIENEIYIEVSGDALTDGMRIISDSTGITNGATVEVQENASRRASGQAPDGQQQGGFQMGIPGMGGGNRAPAGAAVPRG